MLNESGVNKSNELTNNAIKEIIRNDNKESLISMVKYGFQIDSFNYKEKFGINAFIDYRLDCGYNNLGDLLLFLLSTLEIKNVDFESFINLFKFNNLNELEENTIECLTKKMSSTELNRLKNLIFVDSTDDFKDLDGLFDDSNSIITKVDLNNIYLLKGYAPYVVISQFLNKELRDKLSKYDMPIMEILYIKEENMFTINDLKSDIGVGMLNVKEIILSKDAETLKAILDIYFETYTNNIESLVEFSNNSNNKEKIILTKNNKNNIESDVISNSKSLIKEGKSKTLIDNKKMDVLRNALSKELTKADIEQKTFDIFGDSDYKISSINAFVVLENTSTYETESVSIQTDNIEDLNKEINAKILELNNKNDEKLANSVIELMKNNPQFKEDMLKMMKKAQLTESYC